MATQEKSALLKTHLKEYVKQYVVYDGQDRIAQVYEAAVDTPDQGPCVLTEYEYRTPTSTQILKRKESTSVWSFAYDI